MNVLEFSALIGLGSLLAGFLGALTGLGGGVVVVPMLALLFHVDIRYAIGASRVSVIATSSGAAAAYVRDGYSNIRIGMFLETATTVGALAGVGIALYVSSSAIAVVFGVVLLYSAYLSSRHPVLGLLYAFGQIMADPTAGDTFSFASTLVSLQPAIVARMVGDGLYAKQLANMDVSGRLPVKSTLWDEMIDVTIQIEQRSEEHTSELQT